MNFVQRKTGPISNHIEYAMLLRICDKKCIFYDRKSFKEKEHDTMKAKGKITKNNIP